MKLCPCCGQVIYEPILCTECGKHTDLMHAIRDVVDLTCPIWRLNGVQHVFCEQHDRLSFVLAENGSQVGYIDDHGCAHVYSWYGDLSNVARVM
jgi:hypothetical protein